MMKPLPVFALVVLAACATTGEAGEGDKNLPSAGVGPFRKLEPEEVKGLAPFVLQDEASLYREPAVARAAHRQHAPYLDAVNDQDADNPADYAIHLTRRARGLPLWTSLLAYGTDAYVDAVEQCLGTAAYAAKRIEASPVLELATDPQLSVVLFRRTGWDAEDHARWSRRARAEGLGLVTPTTFAGRTALRLCFVNPRTTGADVDLLLASLEGDGG